MTGSDSTLRDATATMLFDFQRGLPRDAQFLLMREDDTSTSLLKEKMHSGYLACQIIWADNGHVFHAGKCFPLK